MRQLIKSLFTIILLAIGLQTGWSFALLGPTGNGGDSWQTAVIGYDLAYLDKSSQFSPGGPVFLGDIGGPKNIGEEYRRNTPVIYYAYDANFFGFFGLNGADAADGAFGIMNSLTNVSSYSSDLSEFPLQSQHINYLAQSVFLTDLKSVTLHLLVEQMGLASPERFTWTLAERNVPPGCPFTTTYLVVQRNFDISPTAPEQIQYSSYVNDVLYSYFIVELCPGSPNPRAYTVPFAVDPAAEAFTAVAANNGDGFGPVFIGGVSHTAGGGLQVGGFYTGLTRDDVGGLRYLLRSLNINTENAAAGSLLFSTNLPPPQLLTTLPFGLFTSQQTNDPATLQALYPSLIINTTTTNFYLTNITTLVPTFTNFPGATTTNFGPLQLFFNFDLSLFSSLAHTSAPPVLQALYPDLLILSSSIASFTTVSNPVILVYLTNQIGAPAGSPPRVAIVTNGYTFSFITNYNYTFGNILTNVFSPSNQVTIQTIVVTNLIGAPAGSPQSTNVTSVTKFLTNNISGDFFLVPTNWCGFSIQATQVVLKVPSYTNIVVDTGTTNAFGSAQGSQNTIFYYTNRIYAVYPGICEPTLIFTTNTTSFVVTNYQYTFANLFTNPPTAQFSNTPVTIIITNISPCSNGVAGTLCTNITIQNTFFTNVPTGDFFIIPVEWTCGFNILQVTATNRVGITNTVTAPVPLGVTNIGQQFSVTTILFYTNHTLLIQPLICQTTQPGPALREGIEKIRFVRANFDSLIGQFFQPITNTYTMIKVTNSQPVTEVYQRVITQPDILLSAANFIGANTFNGSVERNINFDTSQVLSNRFNALAGPGVINSPVTFSYNKIGDAFRNGPLIALGNTNQFLSQVNQYATLGWGSFDGSTNDPVVYPNGTSIQNLENQILVQISPASLPNGTVGVSYPVTTFTASAGSFSPPFTWSATGLPSGLTLSSNGTLSGTPTQAGVYNVTIQLTDSLARSVHWNYPLTIQ